MYMHCARPAEEEKNIAGAESTIEGLSRTLQGPKATIKLYKLTPMLHWLAPTTDTKKTVLVVTVRDGSVLGIPLAE